MNPRKRIWKYGDNINTDVIFPGKYTYTMHDPTEMASHALEDLDPTFASNVQTGDIIVAGKNFGNGSSREQAVTCLTAAGVGAVIAISFARISYRNAINNGLPAIICPRAVAEAEHGGHIMVDMQHHTIALDAHNFPFAPFSETARDILEVGGVIEFVKQKVQNQIDS